MTPRLFRYLLALFMVVYFSQVIESATRYIDPLCGEISTYNPAAVGTARCTGGTATSKPGITGSISIMAPGDILYIRGSTTSTPVIYPSKIANPPSGTGASGRTVISAYPINRTCSGHNPADVTTCIGSTYENVLFKPVAVAPVIDIRGAGAAPGPKRDPKWITIEGIRVDASLSGGKGITVTGGGSSATNPPACDNASKDFDTTPDHLRFLNMEIFGSPSSAYLGDLYNESMEIIGNYIHNNGKDLGKDHGLYYGGSDGWIYGNRLENNKTYGLHLYGQADGNFLSPVCDPFPAGNVVEANIFSGNRTGLGILASHKSAIVKNNLVYGNTEIGIHVTSGNGGVHKVYNNTSINNGTNGLHIGEFADNTIIRNNIYDRLFTEAGATGLTVTNNYDCGTTCVTATAFVNAGTNPPDLRLRAGDARIDAGINLTSEGVTKDFAGNARPAGGAFDIGAFEFNASGPPVQTFDFEMANDVDTEVGLTIVQGTSDAAEITLTTLGGTATDVTLTAEGLPSNATASFSDSACTPNCTSTVTIDTANTTPEGTYVVTIRGRTGESIGSLQRTTSLTLIVTCN